ncbi:hypothetical protein BT63DRAFT_382566 [Microthyrium microscopicum]|uniref:Uncharacterized protein n=1 Tax=Microthyrium microscopicum TaxID=703497 RepID=A0A6A6UME1_9PEZI|nr:hypothetical protein BT63DRAFT_382566 [Microthyrium microscopicum]
MSIPNDICLFWYTTSPYARKISWYLTLRGLAHAQCMQPNVLPRPDMEQLNIAYRRIPLLAVGKDVYLDTRLILPKLEALFPDGAIGPKSVEEQAIQRLLEKWTSDAGVFTRSAQLIPLAAPAMKDPNFRKDREDFTGRPWDLNVMARARPEATVHIRDAFEILETTLLADGREWIFNTEKPSLGDIDAVWPFHWLVGMPTALDPNYISPTQFPKTFAYIDRFGKALKAARESLPKPVSVTGAQVVEHMANARFYEPAGNVDANDPTGLKSGDEVTIGPLDSGAKHRDTGRLVTLTPNEVVLAKQTRAGGMELHVHAPRWGFRVFRATGGKI